VGPMVAIRLKTCPKRPDKMTAQQQIVSSLEMKCEHCTGSWGRCCGWTGWAHGPYALQ
jgi:hypothetical protein